MNANELVPDARRRHPRVNHVDLATALVPSKLADRGRLRCVDVARNRARRYASRHRIARPLWSLIAAIILVGLIFERRTAPVLLAPNRATGHGDTKAISLSERPDASGAADEAVAPGDTGGAARGQHMLHYRPSVLAKDVGQIVAYLTRNRGRVDTEAVRAKWAILDRISLPLAIYLREVEASAAWDDLEREISTAPLGAPVASGMDIARSPRHRKILRLLPEWVRRGDELLSGDQSLDSDPKPVPTVDYDDDPDTKPRRP